MMIYSLVKQLDINERTRRQSLDKYALLCNAEIICQLSYALVRPRVRSIALSRACVYAGVLSRVH